MKRWTTAVLATAMLIPAAAEAQRPSSNVHTRSAETYLVQAEQEPVLADKRGFFEKALEASLAGIKASPDNPRSWYQAGVAYAGLKDWAGADSTFDRAASLYPEYAAEIDPVRLAAWIEAYNAGVTALQANNVEEAQRSLELANMLYKKRPEAMVTLGSLYVQQGDFVKGEAVFREALELLRGPARANLNEQQAASWAEDELTVALRLSNIYVEQEKFAEAEQVYRALLESQPENGMARANLAVVLARAGKTEEAAAIYRELLGEEELSEATLFNIGIGLFRAQDFGQAARAFERARELNPVAHETLYNLGQSLYAQASRLETESETADAARKREIQTELGRLYGELLTRTEELLTLDPTNRNAMMMLAQSQRSLAELDTVNADGLRRNALATLEAHEATPFEITNIRIVPAEGSVQILGRVTNLKAAEGSTITFRFSAVDRAGTEIAGEDITVTAPAVGAGTNFDMRLTVPEGAAGWKYVVRG